MKRAIIAVLALSGCGGPSLSDNQKAEVENIAEDFADGTASNFDPSELNGKIEELEAEIGRQQERDSLTFRYAKSVSEDLDGLRDHYNKHLRDHHGAP